ncbi:hypothetical protein SAMN04487944_11580 [Gracilibacillus ureilyticus]|uniref:DUF5643 domain-containing protein n=1 Tax=Gracilibacillus ureilyticus TaxID=531814 RepID=A0A1H9TZA2_9BACI|nr:DUF5643 domain-containing protein [Gracilibacillus ureilyticus]SES02449.1 hypothetical protein SAMN04487944_11580 [Gracilibacillus ureilyticus]
MGIWIRRLIIIVCAIALIPNIISFFSGLTNGLPERVKSEVENGDAVLIDLDKKVNLENDEILFKHLVLAPQETSLIFEVHTNENGWSFPDSALILTDRQGNIYRKTSGSASGHTWGQYRINHYEPLKTDVETIVLDFEWFDRKFQTEFSVDQGDLE